MTGPRQICLIGFGEVGQLLARQLPAHSAARLVTWDTLFSDAQSPPSRALSGMAVSAAEDFDRSVHRADLIICAVTAAECLNVARAAAPVARFGATYLDLNSVAPDTKCTAEQALAQRGIRYVEAAVMSPIQPLGLAAPILLGGPCAADFLSVAKSLGFSGASVYSPVTGRASAAKMCRSVLIKGLESLVVEALVSARRHGVEDTVVESLGGLLPAADWPSLCRYLIARSLQHGTRRAAEMREAARTVAAAGLEPWMASACAERQAWTGGRAEIDDEASLGSLLDAFAARLT